MKTFYFARNTTREYYQVKAETSAQAYAKLEQAFLEGELFELWTDERENDLEDAPYELVDEEV